MTPAKRRRKAKIIRRSYSSSRSKFCLLFLSVYFCVAGMNSSVEALLAAVSLFFVLFCRQLDWRPEKKGDARKRHEKVVIIRNMFHPSDFEV